MCPYFLGEHYEMSVGIAMPIKIIHRWHCVHIYLYDKAILLSLPMGYGARRAGEG